MRRRKNSAMKRSLVYLLIAVVVAGFIGTLVARDPGYVLISYGGASLQTGIWVAIAILLAGGFAIFYALRLLRIVGSSATAFRSWREDRAKTKTWQLTSRGLIYFQAGYYERAERFLESGARDNANPAASLIYAARAADAQGKAQQREEYLRRAREADPEAAEAVAIASATMAIARREYARALKALEDARPSGEVTRLKGEALLAMEDWDGLADVVPELRKSGAEPSRIAALQKRVAFARLQSAKGRDDLLESIFKKLPDDVRRDPDMATAYVRSLTGESAVESAIRGILKQDWIAGIVSRYGDGATETLGKRIKTAEGWLKSHPDDAALQLCLGKLYEANNQKDKARSAYQRSVDLKESQEALQRLGRMFAFEGDYKMGSEYYARALALHFFRGA